MTRTLTCMLWITSLAATDHVAYNPDGFGKLEGATHQCERTVKAVKVANGKEVRYVDLAFSGKEWSGAIHAWTGFNKQAPGVDPEQYPVMVLVVAGDARPHNHALSIAMMHKDGESTGFKKLSTWDRKAALQKKPKGWSEIRIPLEDLGVTGPV